MSGYSKPPENNAEGLLALTTDRILNAYNGIAGRCACGCSGVHSYMRGEDGTPVRPKSVAATLRTIQRHADEADWWTYSDGSEGWGYQSDTRLYCVYTQVPA